jgi:N-acetylglucosaminyldiphosphoundecaprenol N-acetyl-beta-D-mannosaminyltransferase
MQRYRLHGVPVDAVTLDEALSKTEQFVQDGKSHLVVHLSLPLLSCARRNKTVKMLLEEADIVIPTGRYIHWASRVLNKPVVGAIDASVFVKRLMVQSADLGKKVYLFGGKGYTVDKACENLKKEMDRLFVIGKYRGNYRKQEHENIVTAIGKTSPDYFFVGLGSPHEELWVNWNRKRTNAKLTVLIEDLLDLFAGKIGKRSPYKDRLDFERLPAREIPNSHAFKMVFLVPVFVISVLMVKVFRKKRS